MKGNPRRLLRTFGMQDGGAHRAVNLRAGWAIQTTRLSLPGVSSLCLYILFRCNKPGMNPNLLSPASPAPLSPLNPQSQVHSPALRPLFLAGRQWHGHCPNFSLTVTIPSDSLSLSLLSPILIIKLSILWRTNCKKKKKSTQQSFFSCWESNLSSWDSVPIATLLLCLPPRSQDGSQNQEWNKINGGP